MGREADPTRRLYLEELSRKTVLVGRWSMLLGAAVLAFFVLCDTMLVQVRGSLPWRFFGIACCLGFLSLAHTRLKRDPRLAIPLYAVALAGFLLSVCGVACTIFNAPPPVPGAKYGAVAGVIVAVLALFVFASGARRHLPYVIGVPLALMVAYVTLSGVLAPHEWIHVVNPVLAGIAVVAMSLIQEPIFYNEFKMRQLALETNVQLKEAQEILKQAHDEELQRHRTELAHAARLSMMGEMAASLAHELNQPLYAVKNYAYGSICRLCELPQRDEELVTVLKKINEEAGRAAEIIRRVKAFLQKRQARSTDVPLRSVIEEAILFSQMDIERSRTTITLERATDLPAVIGDPIQIEQVIINLIRNSLEAMDQVPVERRRLTIKACRQDAEIVRIDVRDEGPGLEEADLDKVCEPFYTTKPPGLGMGLAISRSIIQADGGHLWVSKNKDQGCTFHFTLPVTRDAKQ